MLTLLPDLKFPITAAQFNPLMDSLVQVNLLDAGVTEKQQRGLGIYLSVLDLYCKSGGRIDYRGPAGHQRLIQDSMIFAGSGNPTSTRHGDLAAAHLSIDYSDTVVRLRAAGMPLLSGDVNYLLNECRDLSEYSPQQEKQVGIILDMLGKKSVS